MQIAIHPNYIQYQDFILNLPNNFPQCGETIYKGRNEVKRFFINDTCLIAKKFKRPHLIQRIIYTFFKKSKAERAYLFAQTFRERGFNTPHEIAFIETKENGLFADGYFISAECTAHPLWDLLNKEEFEKEPADALAQLLVNLHEKKIFHGDLNLTNILYQKTTKGYEFTFIDTNRSTFPLDPTPSKCLNNLTRLTHNKKLLEYVVSKYALKRDWPPEKCIIQVMNNLAKFERKKRKKRKLQSIIGINK